MVSHLKVVPAVKASRQLGAARTDLQRTIERLVKEHPRSAAGSSSPLSGSGSGIRALLQATRNAQDAIHCVLVAERILGELEGPLTRALELTRRLQATQGEGSAKSMDLEFQSLLQAVVHTVRNARFNGQPLFDSAPPFRILVDAETAITVELPTLTTGASEALGLSPFSTRLASGPETAAAAEGVAAALDRLQNVKAELASRRVHLAAAADTLGTQVENSRAAFGSVQNAERADEVVALAKFQILNQGGAGIFAQGGRPLRSLLSLLP